MLDPWIIDEILKREEEKRREQEHRVPLEKPRRPTGPQPAIPAPAEENERGVTVIDI